jgi:hypothetical protein
LIVRCKDLKAQKLIGVSEIHGHTSIGHDGL